jgi:uncharacterized protein
MKKNKFNIKQQWIQDFYTIFENINSLDEVILFGSRARGDHKSRSDIDLAIDIKNNKTYSQLLAAIEESNILLKVDLIDINTIDNPVFLKNIKKDGIIFWKRDK